MGIFVTTGSTTCVGFRTDCESLASFNATAYCDTAGGIFSSACSDSDLGSDTYCKINRCKQSYIGVSFARDIGV